MTIYENFENKREFTSLDEPNRFPKKLSAIERIFNECNILIPDNVRHLDLILPSAQKKVLLDYVGNLAAQKVEAMLKDPQNPTWQNEHPVTAYGMVVEYFGSLEALEKEAQSDIRAQTNSFTKQYSTYRFFPDPLLKSLPFRSKILCTVDGSGRKSSLLRQIDVLDACRRTYKLNPTPKNNERMKAAEAAFAKYLDSADKHTKSYYQTILNTARIVKEHWKKRLEQ